MSYRPRQGEKIDTFQNGKKEEENSEVELKMEENKFDFLVL